MIEENKVKELRIKNKCRIFYELTNVFISPEAMKDVEEWDNNLDKEIDSLYTDLGGSD